MNPGRRFACALVTLLTTAAATPGFAQVPSGLTPAERQKRLDTEKELQALAVVERKVMVPMRDGVRLATDVYRPRSASDKVPIVFVRTPYNFNFWDVRNGVPADLTSALTAVKRGYAYVIQNERGHFFSEGSYDILGAPVSDGYDMLDWLQKQPWSSGKVGTTGCSSTAEYQLAVAAQGHPAYGAMNVQGFGAGVGRVGPYYEQGNWYRGGAVQMLFISWLYGEQNQVRPMFPKDTPQADLVRASKAFDLAQQLPPVDWDKALRHLPVQDILKDVDGPRGIFADAMPVPTGGRMIERAPNDAAWYKGGLWHDDMKLDVPGLWFMSWYDVSVGPNLALFNHVRQHAPATVKDQQWAVIAPVAHCGYTRATEDTVVGERSMGDARLDYEAILYGFFDKVLKGEKDTRVDALPKVTYFTMGANKWQTSSTWPPMGSRPLTFYLSSGGRANSLNGDGVLARESPAVDKPDTLIYDPANPVPSYGGNVCCTGNAVQAGSFDQRRMEARTDVLVFTSEAFQTGTELSGPIVPSLFVSSDVKDTDITVKVLDVYPDGSAFNLDESIQRLRYRDGYDKPLAWMEKDKVYKVTLQPLNTSNFFPPGHRLRIEVSSSNFPRFDRNLNTGGHNYDEATGVVAHNVLHHSRKYPSELKVTVVERGPSATKP
ncbi:MAG TPA: CocE/NonD family hydrolase [Vicinamibacteria bacterium]|nr:CocE/NonD family hydrolase [Vicinamibacteria bacterium]